MKIDSLNGSYDIVVVGGGMVGASFACALDKAIADENLSILVVEAVLPSEGGLQQPSFDARSTALSYGSRQIYESMGLWDELEQVLSPIKEIHVSDKGRPGSARLHHSEHQVEALGYVVENADLGVVLNKQMGSSKSIKFLAPARIEEASPIASGMSLEISHQDKTTTIETPLVVLADGGRSPICSQLGIEQLVEDYNQHALISNVAFDKPHEGIAYERFTDSGPLAILPLRDFEEQHRGSLVWTLGDEEKEEVMAMDNVSLIPRLMERFGNRLGPITQIGEKFCYPLKLSVAKEQVRPGLVLLGNVAHAIHPVAGQGLNLALRDTQVLVETLQEAREQEQSLGSMAVLQSYIDSQDFDQQKTIRFTDSLVRLFSNNQAAKVMARSLGLLSIDLVPSLKKGFAEQAMGLK